MPRSGSNIVAPNGVSINGLQYNEVGLTTLRAYLGDGPVYERFKQRFDTADVAWFVAGAHRDGKHQVPPSTFHPAFTVARETTASDAATKSRIRTEVKTNLKNLVFDAATTWDRVTGGCTLVIHTDGTMEPGQPCELEFVKMDAYFPPHILTESPRTDRVIAEIVQKFAEGLGLPAARRWNKAFKNAGYNFSDREVPRPMTSVAGRMQRPLVPKPPPGSSVVHFYGRPVGEIYDMMDMSIGDTDRGGPARREGTGLDVDDPLALRRRIRELEAVVVEKDAEIAQLREELNEAAYAPAPFHANPPTPTPEGSARGTTTAELFAPRPRAGTLLSAPPSTPAPSLPRPTPLSAVRVPPPSPRTPPLLRSPFAQGSAASARPMRSAKSPMAATSPTAMSSLSSQLSSTSLSDLLRVSGSSSPLIGEMTFEMPSRSEMGLPELSQPRTHQRPTPSRFSKIGPAMADVITRHHLSATLHRDLRGVIESVPDDEWLQELVSIIGVDYAVAEELVDAMNRDCPATTFSTAVMPISYGAPVAIVAKPYVPPEKKRQPLTLSYQQRVELAAARSTKQAAIDEEIAKWYQDSVTFAEDLARRHGRTSGEYLNQMFSGVLKLHTGQRKPNGYNAFLHHMSKEDGGNRNIVELSEAYHDVYDQLTPEQKQQYLDELKTKRESQQYGLRLDQRSRMQDVNHTMKSVEDALLGLQARVGVAAMVLVVRSNTDYQLKPRWFFTSPELQEFLSGAVRKFEPEKVSVLAEAFAIAGSDYFSQLRTANEKVNFLKSEIRELVSRALATITGDDHAIMNYVHFTRDVQLKYGITMEGWTHSQWANPSELSNSIPPLKELRDTLKAGTCRFVRLTPDQLSAIQKEYEEQIKGGNNARKKRSDAGKPRKKRSDAGRSCKENGEAATSAGRGAGDDGAGDDDGEGNAGLSKRRRVGN
ncbi:hypothetical protein OH77DRAFT_1515077 [Trametes cingulata]|nr:hypothetical protein OH77DRAFT_1515077 [Trametes cingulata]